MNEPKFRAWDGKKLRRVYGLQWNANGIKFIRLEGYTDNLKVLKNIILMQYIGLKDWSGVEICEGDLIEWKKKIYIVSRIHGAFGLFDTETNLVETFLNMSHSCSAGIGWAVLECTVKGNIYENKELFE